MNHQFASFADAEAQNDFSELIPNGYLSWGVLKIRPANGDQGIIETPSKSSDARYLDCEVTLMGGHYDKRKVWTRIGVSGSEKYVNMGRSAIKAIMETGRRIDQMPEQARPEAYGLPMYNGLVNWMELDGLTIAVKVKVDPPQNGYPEKNEIAVWISPLDTGTSKLWERLHNGDVMPKPRAGAPGAPGGQQPQQPSFGLPQPNQPAAVTQAPTGPAAAPPNAASVTPPAASPGQPVQPGVVANPPMGQGAHQSQPAQTAAPPASGFPAASQPSAPAATPSPSNGPAAPTWLGQPQGGAPATPPWQQK